MELVFAYLGSVEPESVRFSKGMVTGKWSAELMKAAGPTPQEFVNWPATPQEILRFTKSYGPLWQSYGVLIGNHDVLKVPGSNYRNYGKGAEFSFALSDWRKLQEDMQKDWRRHSDASAPLSPGVRLVKGQEKPRKIQLSGVLMTFTGNTAMLTVGTLWRSLQLQLDLLDPRKVKVCQNPE